MNGAKVHRSPLPQLPRKPVLYAAYWAGYVLLFSLVQGLPAQDFGTALCNELLSLPPKLLFVLVVVEVLMPRYWGRWAVFMPAYSALLLLSALLQRVIDNTLILPYFLTDWKREPLLSVPPYLYSVVKLQFVVTVPACARLLQFVARERNATQLARAEQLQAELAVLRSQFHPHFLFNVLNGLYSKVLSGGPEAPDMVLRLSEMMRYHVYEAGAGPVPLAREVDYLRSFIALQRQRFGNRLSVSAAFEGPLDAVHIEPLLLQPFVENAFKHALDAEAGDEGWITLYLSVAAGEMTLRLENSRPAVRQPSPPTGGAGLRQVRRRLELLYPGRYELMVEPEADRYFVLLKLQLHEA